MSALQAVTRKGRNPPSGVLVRLGNVVQGASPRRPEPTELERSR